MENLTNELVNWVKQWFEENGNEKTKAVVGISGGKDSSVVAALCCRALGPERVFGVIMPCGTQSDIADSYSLVEHLGIDSVQVNIGPMYDTSLEMIENAIKHTTDTSTTERPFDEIQNPLVKGNLQSRLRMVTLYAISQELGGRVSNNCNKSERFVGYSTLYGDNAGDFAPLADLTVSEVMKIGGELGLPKYLANKTPIDGLENNKSGVLVLTDEDSMGFSYADLEKFINTGTVKGKPQISKLIADKHNHSEFKRNIVKIPYFKK